MSILLLNIQSVKTMGFIRGRQNDPSFANNCKNSNSDKYHTNEFLNVFLILFNILFFLFITFRYNVKYILKWKETLKKLNVF